MPLFDGIDNLMDQWLGLNQDAHRYGQRLPRYKTRQAAIDLSGNGQEVNDTLITNCMQQLNKNFDAIVGDRELATVVSPANWRWKRSLQIATRNASQEKLMEKFITFLCDSWVNQMPVCNGFHGENGRASSCRIDLVHQIDKRSYDLVELKYADTERGGSNHPLFAAMENLKYGLCYFLFRQRNLIARRTNLHHILSATKIRLVVLAPPQWYQLQGQAIQWFDYAWLENALTTQLQAYANENLLNSLTISFKFEVMTQEFLLAYSALASAAAVVRYFSDNPGNPLDPA